MITPSGQETRLSFGPQLKEGDTVTVELDALKKEVSFYRNQARASGGVSMSYGLRE